MTIGHALQKGTLIYIYGIDGKQITSLSAPGRWPSDGLKGFTRHAVHIQKGTLLYAYDECGHQVGLPVPVRQGNIEYIQNTKRLTPREPASPLKYTSVFPEAIPA